MWMTTKRMCITITEEDYEWFNNNSINLSKFLRKCIENERNRKRDNESSI